MPKELKDKKYYMPSDSGYESRIKERLKSWEEEKEESQTEMGRDVNKRAQNVHDSLIPARSNKKAYENAVSW